MNTGCFLILALMNNATTNVDVQISLWASTYTFHSRFSTGNILHNYNIPSKPGNRQWYNPEFIQASPCVHVHVCVVLCNSITYVVSCNHHHNQDTEPLKKKKKKVQNISLAPENSLLHCTVTPCTPAPGNLWSTFCCRLILSFPEFYNNEIVQHAFVFLLSSLSAIFRDSSGGCTAEFFWFCFCCCEIWIHPSLSLVDGYLGGFQFGDFMSTSAVKICAQAMSGHMLSFLLSKYLEI